MFSSEILYTLIPGAEKVVIIFEVSHFDCGGMTENTLHAINEEQKLDTTPEELEVSQKKTFLYTKHFRKEIKAKNFQTQHQREKRHCNIMIRAVLAIPLPDSLAT